MHLSSINRLILISLVSLIIYICITSVSYHYVESAPLFERKNAVVLAVEKVGGAVVNINTEEVYRIRTNPFYGLGNSIFEEFFSDFFPERNYITQSLGSGVIINADGYILTNEHVISRASKIKISLIDNRQFEAQLIGADAKSDLAVIKIDSQKPLPFVEMGSSDDLMIGESVIAIGNPFALSHTVTTGIISALNRTIRGEGNRVYSEFIQVDASINPGNSGGPLLNINGQLIGINTAIYQKAEGIGFAIPINKAKRIVSNLIKYGKIQQGWLGLMVQDITPEIVNYFNLKDVTGVMVSKVFNKSPAGKAGIKEGDIITAIDKKPIYYKEEYQSKVSSYTPNDDIELTILKNGKEGTFKINAATIPQDMALEIARAYLGITVDDINAWARRKYNIYAEGGVLITSVDPNSPVDRIGIKPGDVILQIDNIKIKDIRDYRTAFTNMRQIGSILLLIQRDRYGYYVTVDL